jgi:hypothetical protein
MVLGELSKTVWEVATVLQLNSRYLSFGGGKGLTGTAPPLIRTAVRGAVVAERRWEPHGVRALLGPMRCG